MLVALIPTAGPTTDAAPIPTFYLDENSDIPINVNAEPVPQTGNLTAGYWVVDREISRAALTISGDVILILEDGYTLTVTSSATTGITVPAGSSLTVYPQSRDMVTMGRLYCSVVLTGGHLVNVGWIEYSSTTINTVNITAVDPLNDEVTNYGLIRNNNTARAINSTVGVTVNNDVTLVTEGRIISRQNMLQLGAGSTLNNYGLITELVPTNSTGVLLAGNCTFINYGRIILNPLSMGVLLSGSNNTVTNYGLIESGTCIYGNGTITNETSGLIECVGPAGSAAIHLSGGNSNVVNRGKIEATVAAAGILMSTSTAATIDNYSTITSHDVGIKGATTSNFVVNNYGYIEGTTNAGIHAYIGTINNYPGGTIDGIGHSLYILGAGVTATNSGTFQGDVYIQNNSSFVLINNSIINGNVTLTNAVNNVTFKAGSVINGNFIMGTNTASNLYFTGTPDSSLVYATITGTSASIGNNSTRVHIDGTALPPMAPGDVLTLINIHSTGSVTTAPRNPATETIGGYLFEVKIESRDLIARVLAVNYAIAVTNTATGDPLGPHDPYTFTSAPVGYAPQSPLDVTVENIGSNATGDLTIVLSGADAASFTLSKTAISSLAVAATDTFTVVPINSLARGTYTAIVTVETAAGNSNPIAPISFEISFRVTGTATTTALTSSVNPSVYSQSVTFTATVTGGAPTGNVEFFVGGVSVGTFPLAGGVATYTTSTLSVGDHHVTAEYLGDALHDGSEDAVGVIQEVIKADTSTHIVSSHAPSVIGDTVTFTATVTAVAPATGVPTGNVEFYNGAVLLGTHALNGLGVATFTISTLTIGDHTITARYDGDANFNGSSDAMHQIVTKIHTTTTVDSSVNPSVHGQSVTFTATVTGGTPTGVVHFYNNGVLMGTHTLNASGIATFTTSTLSVGTHPITAEYVGDATHEESEDLVGVDQVVNKANTETTVVSNHNPSVYGQSVTFTATVVAVHPGAGTPTGSVEFYDGGLLIGTSTLNATGHATFTTSTLTVGNHPITAIYLGDTNFNTSTDAVGELQVVHKANTHTVVTSSPNPSVFGQDVTFTATVTAVSPGAGMPTGNLTFYIDGVPVGTFPLDAAGKATFTTNALGVGDHVITAQYEGDTNFNDSMSAHYIQQVTSPGASKLYYIKASAATGTTIYPIGIVAVPKGENQTFKFSATAGYAVSAVLVDGVPLTQAQIDTGTYTFYDVKANHTIEVKSAPAIILQITIHGGDGHADFNLNGRGYVTYYEVTIIPSRAFISLMAFADEGYEFKEWKRGSAVFTEENISFDDVTNDLKLDLYFKEEGSPSDNLLWWLLVLAALLILAGFFWWFLFYYRRKYDVIKVESPDVKIIGDDKVRRKTAYHFTIEGKISGDIYYRIGYDDDTVWKIITPDQNNEYVIPKKEVINDITIELR